MTKTRVPLEDFSELDIGRDRDRFLREILRELTGLLEDVVGREDAEGFLSVIGARLGNRMNEEYRAHLGKEQLSVQEVAAAMVDLKRRIDGGFSVESIEGDEIVLVNDRCPFGEFVEGRTSLCMMTQNVFGRIAAENRDYAQVRITEAIARGDTRCRVVVRFTRTSDALSYDAREYFG